MNRIDLAQAKGRKWDVILVGTSFAAMFFAHALRGRDIDVLFVERGPYMDHGTQLAGRHSDVPPQMVQTNSSGQQKDWALRYQFGGCSNCWWGNTPRLHPSDFALRSRYGVGADWPISYDTLEPWLCKVEEIMQVAGSGNNAIFPRSRPYPYPAHTPTRAERRLFESDKSWTPMPTARANGGDRGTCCASGACHLCPVDAKFTILNGQADFEDPRFYLLTGAECRAIPTAAGLATGIVVRTVSEAETELRSSFVGLAANPMGSSTILLRSGLGGERVGQGIHEQLGQFAWADIPFDNYYGGTSITGVGYALYDGSFRSEAASVLIESWNAPPSLRLEPGKWLQRLKLKFVAEDLPQTSNRIVLENDEPRLMWGGHSAYAFAGLARARSRVADLVSFADNFSFGGFEPTEAHIIGGTPMAERRDDGVVDPECRLFDVPNLACLGASTFPTSSAANPTLTLSALSMFLGSRL